MIRVFLGILLFVSSALAEVKPAMTSFNAGELSPLLRTRYNFGKYDNGCATLQNMLPLSQGPVMRRPGTYYIAETETMTERSDLLSFVYSKTDAYIIEAGDLYFRYYRKGGQIQDPDGTEDMTSVGGVDISGDVVAQWKLNDDAANTTVADAIGSHTGTSTTNTANLSVVGQINAGFDMVGLYAVDVSDHADFTFDDSAGEGFSISAWVYLKPSNSRQEIITKYDGTSGSKAIEWALRVTSNEKLMFYIYDGATTATSQYAYSINAISEGWHLIVVTYDGRGGANAFDGVIYYVDNIIEEWSPATKHPLYVRMRDTSANVIIGAYENSAGNKDDFWEDKLDNIVIFNKVLTIAEIDGLFNGSSTYEINTTYAENEVADLQYVQLADTMFIVHSDHEPRKLTRTGHTAWTIADVNYIDGPFKTENTDTSITVTPSATTGTITLDSNSDIFSANLVGALWEIRHPRSDATLSGSFTSATSSSAIACEGDFKLTTHGTWTGTLDLERSLDGSTWEKVSGGHVNSVDDDNISFSDSEPDSGYTYRVTMTAYTSGTCTYDFIVYDHMHTGVVRIATYVDPNEVTATVHTALGATTATYYHSEGYWSPKNGYPATIEFHEFRLWYGGSAAYPQTIWATRTDDFEKMKTGTLDSHAMIYQLPGQNPIQWLLSDTYLMIGTLGGAGRMGDPDEEMTPLTKPTYRHQTTDGSAYIQAVHAGDAILYVENGGQRVREFVYTLERDKFVSPDMTVLAEHITGNGIEDIAFQSRPEKLLWSVREDGNFLSMSYNREQDVIAWAEHVTDGDVEALATIPGTYEDEVWLIVNRTIDSSTKRYIERMMPHDWGSDDNDTFFVDCGLTFDGGDTVVITGVTKANPAVVTVSTWPTEGDGTNLADDDQITIVSVSGMIELNGNVYTMDDANVSAKTFSLNNSANTADIDSTGYTTYTSGGTAQRAENSFSGFDHLEGETLAILGDGAVQTSQTSSSGAFTISNWVNKMHAGLPYTSILETMPIVWAGPKGSVAADKKQVSLVAMNFYKSLGTKYGVEGDTSDVFTETSLVSGWKRPSFQYGFRTPDTTIYIEQVKPLPLIIRAIIPTVSSLD